MYLPILSVFVQTACHFTIGKVTVKVQEYSLVTASCLNDKLPGFEGKSGSHLTTTTASSEQQYSGP